AIAQDIKPHHTRFEAEEIGLRAFLQYIRKHKHVYNIIWESLYIDKSLFVDYYENFASRYLHGLEAAQERGEIVNVDPTVLSYFLMGVSNFIGLKYVMFDDDDEESFDAVVDQVMEILRTGIFLGK
ncbi:MAG: TetR/AcrR family transcriptional regulator, partial [Clostridium sp.]|nr:TetR/AcrR family transcriptional regulator [Clostridium sp.]